jgi:hypothetical protein
MISLETFKKEYRARLLDLHWSQWATLGVASRLEREKNAVIDLEALMISTLRLGLADKRLLTTAVDWMSQNRQWLNLSRFNRIARYYSKAERQLAPAIAIGDVVSLYLQYLKPATKQTADKVDPQEVEQTASTKQALESYREIFEMARGKGSAVKPNLRDPCLLQLFFRGLFGINARAEILLYLLLRKRGNSNNIAMEVGFDQKIIYRILERWAAAGFVERVEGRDFQLSTASIVKSTLPLSSLPHYINWISGFAFLGRVFTAVETEPFSEDKYLLSSLFRDLLPDARVLAGTVGFPLTDDRLHRGADYFEVFSSELLDMLEQLQKVVSTSAT